MGSFIIAITATGTMATICSDRTTVTMATTVGVTIIITIDSGHARLRGEVGEWLIRPGAHRRGREFNIAAADQFLATSKLKSRAMSRPTPD